MKASMRKSMKTNSRPDIIGDWDTTTRSKPHTYQFEYVENAPPPKTGNNSEGKQMSGHVAPPMSSNFFANFGMDNGYYKKSMSSSYKEHVTVSFKHIW
jgi:ADP-ribosylation factor GTPase-activating protein 2/3